MMELEMEALKIAVEINKGRGMSRTDLVLKDAEEVLEWLKEQSGDQPVGKYNEQMQDDNEEQSSHVQDSNQVWGIREPEVKNGNIFSNMFGIKKKNKASKPTLPSTELSESQTSALAKITKMNPLAEAYTSYYLKMIKKKRIYDMDGLEANELIKRLEDPTKNYAYDPAFRKWYLEEA